MTRVTRRGFVKASSVLATVPVFTAFVAHAQTPAPDTGNLRVEKDIVFGKGANMNLTLDVYQPPVGNASKRTAIIHSFGGGFIAGSKNAANIVNDAKALGTRGYTSVSANYRLQTQGFWPAQIHDLKAAIRWTRANAARLDVDPNKIVVAGYSAGAMLSLMSAGTNGRKEFDGDGGNVGVSSDVNGCIGVYALTRALPGLFPEGKATPETLAAASPTSYITNTFVPTILIHGTGDKTIPAQSSVDVWAKLHGLGVPTALTLIQGADHAFDSGNPDAVETMAASIDLFLDRLLVNPRPYPSFGFGGGRGGRAGRGGQGTETGAPGK